MTGLRFWRWAAAALWMVSAATAAGHGQRPAEQQPSTKWFRDATAGSGVEFVHQRGDVERYWLPEIMSGGAAWCDFDDDGDPDLYLVQGGSLLAAAGSRGDSSLVNRLFENRSASQPRFIDVTARAGLGDSGYGIGAACADYDNDGDLDLYVSNVGSNRLYQNRGDGRFLEVAANAGVDHDGWSTGATFFDYDADGDLDLFVASYIRWAPEREIECSSGPRRRDYCQPENYRAPAPDVLYRNRGDGTFEDVTVVSGIASVFGNGLGVVAADFDLDQRMDLYVANDGNPNLLWMNQGDGRFVERGLLSGSAVSASGTPEAGMGVALGDPDRDGDFDLLVTHLRGETNTLYLNQSSVAGSALFDDATAAAGLAAASLPWTGFGVAFADFDHDRRLDVVIGNGRVGQGLPPVVQGKPFAEPNLVFRQLPDGRFEELMPRGSVLPPSIENSRAVALADYDQDGDLDFAVVNNGGPAQLFENVAQKAGGSIELRVLDGHGRDALGARIRLVDSTGAVQWQQVLAQASYASSHDPIVHFGLGEAREAASVVVFWLDGSREAFGPFRPREASRQVLGRAYRLVAGAGRALVD